MQVGLELFNEDRLVLWHVLEAGLTRIGSNSNSDLCIPDDAVADLQCMLDLSGDTLRLLNRATGGTRVSDEVVDDAWVAANGDAIKLGKMTAVVRFRAAHHEGASSTRTMALAPGPATGDVVLEDSSGKSWSVTTSGLTLGSDEQCDVRLQDDFVSGFHARLSLEDGRCMVRDLDSRNGILIGNRKVREGELAPGEALKLGETELRLRPTSDAQAEDKASDMAEARFNPEGEGKLFGTSDAMDKVREIVGRFAKHAAPVLITGETGTGKEVVARNLRLASPRSKGPYLTLNCGALGRNVIESELFGHEKGAFTGAIAQKVGAFEAADGGTLFLDEVGELPLDLQPHLLRVVEYGEVRRVGSAAPFKVDVRLVTATNRDLVTEVQRGRFREDLYHRLSVLCVQLPPLRDRGDDIDQLVDRFLPDLAAGESVSLTQAARAKLRAQPWPGNVRELRNVLQRAILMRDADVAIIDADAIILSPSTAPLSVESAGIQPGRTLAEIEREVIIAELRRHRGNKKETAAGLGVSRSTVHRKVEEYGIEEEDFI